MLFKNQFHYNEQSVLMHILILWNVCFTIRFHIDI